MKFLNRLLITLIALTGFCVPSHAQITGTTLTLGSYVVKPSGFVNTPILVNGAAVLAYDFPSTNWSNIGASTFVTNAQGSQPAGTTVYTTSYVGNLLGSSGSISFQGDDSVSVQLNGVSLGSSGTFDTVTTIPIPPKDFVNGTNTFVFTVVNNTGYTGFDFVATVSVPAPAHPLSIATPTGKVEIFTYSGMDPAAGSFEVTIAGVKWSCNLPAMLTAATVPVSCIVEGTDQ